MSYRTILAQMIASGGQGRRLEMVKALAERFGAHVVAMHVMPLPVMPFGYGEAAAYVGPEIFEAQREVAEAETARLKEKAEAVLGGGKTSFEWVALEGDPGTLFCQALRSCDLAVAAKLPVEGIDALAPQSTEHLIMEGSGPVLMLPETMASDNIGRHVVVAWDESPESARALRDSLPFLQAAEVIDLVTIGDAEAVHLESVRKMLERHEIRVRPQAIAPSGDGTGPQLLAFAGESGADLLVMGAYGHSRLRELVLGGATRHVLAETTIPVLFSC